MHDFRIKIFVVTLEIEMKRGIMVQHVVTNSVHHFRGRVNTIISTLVRDISDLLLVCL